MSAPHNQAGFTPDLHKSKPLRRASISVLILRQLFASMAPFSPKKRKKVPCVWCKIHLTILSSTEISKNRVEKTRKNKQNRPKFAPSQGFFGPFSCLFQPQVSRLMFARLGYFCRPQFPWLSGFPDFRPELLSSPVRKCPRRHIRKRQPRPLPQQPRRAFGRSIQRLNVDRVQSSLQTNRPAIVPQRIARRAADQPERRSGLRHFHSVNRQPRAIAVDQMKRIPAVSGNVDEPIPHRRMWQ